MIAYYVRISSQGKVTVKVGKVYQMSRASRLSRLLVLKESQIVTDQVGRTKIE